MDVVGYQMTKNCADQVFRDAGFAEGRGRDQVGVVELHDCFAANEVCVRFDQTQLFIFIDAWQLITYSALGLCAPGEAHKLVEHGDNTVRPLSPFALPSFNRYVMSSMVAST